MKIVTRIHHKTESEQIRLGLRAIQLKETQELTWTAIAKRLNASTQTVGYWVKKARG